MFKLPLFALLSLVLLFLSSVARGEDDEFEDEDFVSVTGCAMSVGDSMSIGCEHSIFSVSIRDISGELANSSPDDGNLLCSPVPGKGLEGKIAVSKRGVCPFTDKARAAQEAGAIALVISDSQEGTTPVRLKGTGLEETLITIPVVMIGLDDYNEIIVDLDAGEKVEARISQDMTVITKAHPLFEEFDLKGQLMTATERPEFLMQLGAYMQRGGWNETAQVLITMAANNCKDRDFQILYSAGEYFHNVVEDVQRAAGHFFACAEASLNMVKKSATPKDVKKEAMEKLKIVAGLVPERGEQSLIIEALIESKMWRETREIISYLHKETLLGTSGVLAWARYVKEIGKGKALLDLISSGWVENNQLSSDEEWIEVMNNAKEFVQNFVLGASSKKKMEGGGSSEL